MDERAKKSKLTIEQIKKMAQRADLNDRETDAILQLAEQVDFDETRIELKFLRGELSDTEMSAIKKLSRDEHRPKRNTEDRVGDVKSNKLTTEQIKKMAERAGLNEREMKALLQLAERVDFDEGRIELKFLRGELTDTEMNAVKKLSRDDHRGERDTDDHKPRF